MAGNGRSGAGTYAGAVRVPLNLIERAVKEINRKRLNVVVSGLAETGTFHGDAQLFSDLCSEFLGLRPTPTKCVRLGKTSPLANGDTRPRLLLVSFATELEATSIISSARRLREAANDDVRRYVFINRDMTKEESKAAFERRVERRSAATALGHGDQSHVECNCWECDDPWYGWWGSNRAG